MNFFTHPNFPVHAGELLKAFDTANHIEVFPYPPGTPDTIWVPVLGKTKPTPFILSLDDGMLRNRVSKEALRQSGCHFIYFAAAWMDLPWPELAWKLIKSWPNIVDAAAKADRQTVISISVHCKVLRQAL